MAGDEKGGVSVECGAATKDRASTRSISCVFSLAVGAGGLKKNQKETRGTNL